MFGVVGETIARILILGKLLICMSARRRNGRKWQPRRDPPALSGPSHLLMPGLRSALEGGAGQLVEVQRVGEKLEETHFFQLHLEV